MLTLTPVYQPEGHGGKVRIGPDPDRRFGHLVLATLQAVTADQALERAGTKKGMRTFDDSLLALVWQKKIHAKEAIGNATLAQGLRLKPRQP